VLTDELPSAFLYSAQNPLREYENIVEDAAAPVNREQTRCLEKNIKLKTKK